MFSLCCFLHSHHRPKDWFFFYIFTFAIESSSTTTPLTRFNANVKELLYYYYFYVYQNFGCVTRKIKETVTENSILNLKHQQSVEVRKRRLAIIWCSENFHIIIQRNLHLYTKRKKKHLIYFLFLVMRK